jgi:hypothetical protein
VRRELASPVVADEVLRRVCARLRELAKPRKASRARTGELEAQVANLVDAIASGGLRRSPRLAERLSAAEGELAALKAQATGGALDGVERLLPDLAARYQKQLDRLPEVLSGDVTRARSALATHIRPLTVKSDEREIRLYREQGHLEVALMRAAGAAASFCGSGGRI